MKTLKICPNLADVRMWIILCVILVSACQPRRIPSESDIAIAVPSLKATLPHLFEVARQWDSEAYLSEARVEIGFEEWEISAGYQSLNRTQESLLLFLEPDGNTESVIVAHPEGVIQREPIRDSDWTIDSQDAVRRMIRAGSGTRAFGVSLPRCSDVELERFNLLPGDPVVWRLSLWDCSSLAVEYRYMDPITGDILGLDRTLDATEEALLTQQP